MRASTTGTPLHQFVHSILLKGPLWQTQKTLAMAAKTREFDVLSAMLENPETFVRSQEGFAARKRYIEETTRMDRIRHKFRKLVW